MDVVRRYAKHRRMIANCVRTLAEALKKDMPTASPSVRKVAAKTFVLKAYKNLNG